MLGSRELFIQLEKDYKEYEEGIKDVRDQLYKSKEQLKTRENKLDQHLQALGQLLEALVRFKYESGEFLGESDKLPNELDEFLKNSDGLPNELGEFLGQPDGLPNELIPIKQRLKNYYEALKNYYEKKTKLVKKHGTTKELCRICNQAKLISQIIAFIWRWVDEKETEITIKSCEINGQQVETEEEEQAEITINTPIDQLKVEAEEKKQAEITIETITSKEPEKLKKKREIAGKLKQIFDDPYNKNSEGEISLMDLLTKKPKFVETCEQIDVCTDSQKYNKWLGVVFEKYKNLFEKNDIFPIFNDIEKNRYHIFVDCQRFHGELRDPTANAPTKMTISIPYPPRPPLGEATLTKKDLKTWIENTNLDKIIALNPYIPTTCC